jgi:hypothetical protein
VRSWRSSAGLSKSITSSRTFATWAGALAVRRRSPSRVKIALVNRPSVGRVPAGLGLEVARFDADRAGPAVQARIRRDVDSGIASGQVRGTPTLFIDGVLHRGSYDAATLLAALAP